MVLPLSRRSGSHSPGSVIFAVSFLIINLNTVVVSSTAGRGREFIFTFPTNYRQTSPDNGLHLTLSITSFDEGPTNISVTVANSDWSQVLTIPARNGAVTVELPIGAEATGSGLQNSTVLVTASQDVTVFALSNEEESTGGFLVRSTSSLGLDYFVVSYMPIVGERSEFTISATEDDTQVHIQLEAPVVFDNAPYGREELQLSMFRMQTAQFQSTLDLTGSRIRANRPISVISGSSASNVPPEFGSADYVVAHLPPVGTWGNKYALAPVLGRSSGYRCVVVAGCSMTMIRGLGDRVVLASAGDFYEWDAPADTLAVVTSSKPVLVAQISKGHEADGSQAVRQGIGGPALLIIPPIDYFTGEGALMSIPLLPAGEYHHISVTIRCNETGGLTLNNSPLISDREFEYTELDGICTVQKRLQPADPNPVISVDHSSSPGVPYAVSVVVHGAGMMRAAYAVSANLGTDISPCEATGRDGCCYLKDTFEMVSSLSYDEEGSLSSSDYSPESLVARDGVAEDGVIPRNLMLIAQDLTTSANSRSTATYTSSPHVGTSETTAANSTMKTLAQNAVTSTSITTENNSVSYFEVAEITTRTSTLSTESSDQQNISSASPSLTTLHETAIGSTTQTTSSTKKSLVSLASPTNANNFASEAETITATDQSVQSVEATNGPASTSRTHSTWLASTTTITDAGHTAPVTVSTNHTLSTWLAATLTSTPRHQTTTDLQTEASCAACKTPFRILLYGGVAMATLLFLSLLICLVKIIHTRHSAKAIQQKSNGRWVAFPASLSADELSLSRLNLKPPVHVDDPIPTSAETDDIKIGTEGGTSVTFKPGSESDGEVEKDGLSGLVQVRV